MELWQILVICILLLPIFFFANYIIVRKIVAERKAREERIERAIAASVTRSYSQKGADRYLSWPRYKPRRKQ